jgi:hypothetical protein
MLKARGESPGGEVQRVAKPYRGKWVSSKRLEVSPASRKESRIPGGKMPLASFRMILRQASMSTGL